MSERSTKLGDKTEKLLEYWASKGLISAESQQAIREHHAKAAKPSSSVRLPLFLLGAVFLGLGLIFSVGAGWFQVLPPHALPFICLALLALALAIAIALELWEKIDTQKGAARLVSGLAVILCFFLIPAYLVSVARAYQQQSDLPSFYLTWFYAAAPLLILQRRGLLLGLLNILPIPYFILSPSAQQTNLMLFVVLSLLNASYLLLRYQPALASTPARKLLNIANGWPKWAATIKLDSAFWVNIISLLWVLNCYFLFNEYSRYYLESYRDSGTTVDLLFILPLSAPILFGRGMKMDTTSRFRSDHKILRIVAELSLIIQIFVYSNAWYIGQARSFFLNYAVFPFAFFFGLLCLAILLLLSVACHIPCNINERRSFQRLPQNEFAPYLYWSAGYFVLQLLQSFGWLTRSAYLLAYPAWGLLALLLLFALHIKRDNSPSILHQFLVLAFILQYIFMSISDFSLRAIATLVIGAVFLISSLLTLRKRKPMQKKGA